jgi:hypothetical protein
MQREAFVVIRLSEFALTELEVEVNELIPTIQYVIHGKIPVNLINPVTLGSILKNATLTLPENLELFAGVKHNSLYLYYQSVEKVILADVHSFKIMLKVPFKSTNQEFLMYKMFFSLRGFWMTSMFSSCWIISTWL